MATRQQRKQRITTERREQILHAGLSVLSRKASGVASMTEIAREAGVSVGTIYNYFDSKLDLLVSLVGDFVLSRPFVKLLEDAAEADDIDFISAVVDDRINLGFDEADRFFFLMREVQRDPELRRQYAEEVLKPALGIVQRYMELRMASGTFRRVNTEVATRAFGGMFIGMMFLYGLEGENNPIGSMPRRELVSELTDLIIGGLKKDAEP